ncbi:MAG: hypothetical protein ACOVP1_11985 [Bacteroidia bacterium]
MKLDVTFNFIVMWFIPTNQFDYTYEQMNGTLVKDINTKNPAEAGFLIV